MSQENIKLTQALKELVVARLDVMPPEYRLSIGNKGTFSKDDLIKHVMDGDSIGLQVTQMQMNFIKALTTGRLIETLNRDG